MSYVHLMFICYTKIYSRVWGEHGFLKNLGAVDVAGSGPVHLIGGASALASAIMVKRALNIPDKLFYLFIFRLDLALGDSIKEQIHFP